MVKSNRRERSGKQASSNGLQWMGHTRCDGVLLATALGGGAGEDAKRLANKRALGPQLASGVPEGLELSDCASIPDPTRRSAAAKLL